MTVSELIDRLKGLPGDADLRMVVLNVTVMRPYAPDTRMQCRATDVDVERDVCQISGYGHIE